MDILKKTVTSEGLEMREVSRSWRGNNINQPTLVIFFSWLGASEKSLCNYFELYHSLGYDILHVPGNMKHFAWPPTSVNLATVVLNYICTEMSHYRYILVHSMSIGSFNYTSCIMEVMKHPQKYWNFTLRLVGNVFDSITYGSYDRMKTGVSYGLTQNYLVRILIQQFLTLYFIITKRKTVNFYENGMTAFKERPFRVPNIFYYCKDDPMCDHELIAVLIEHWRTKLNMSVIDVCWDSSIHSGHLYKHRLEYLERHRDFLQNVHRYKLLVLKLSKL